MNDETEIRTDGLPPGLVENAEDLKKEVVEAKVVDIGEGKKRRGRKPGSKNKPKEEKQEFVLDYPVEALAVLHLELWGAIIQAMKSQYKLSPEGAKEMGTFANVVLKQYLSPLLAQHAPLAMYAMTQLTALTACFVLREKKPKKQKPMESQEETAA